MRIDVDIVKQVRAARRGFEVAIRFAAETDRLALYGPSGAGKTLTLQMLAGLVRPDRGRIVVDDTLWFDAEQRIDLRPRERGIGYVFQDYALFPHWTVAQNVGGAFARGWPQPHRDVEARRVDDLLRAFEQDQRVQRYQRYEQLLDYCRGHPGECASGPPVRTDEWRLPR